MCVQGRNTKVCGMYLNTNMKSIFMKLKLWVAIGALGNMRGWTRFCGYLIRWFSLFFFPLLLLLFWRVLEGRQGCFLQGCAFFVLGCLHEKQFYVFLLFYYMYNGLFSTLNGVYGGYHPFVFRNDPEKSPFFLKSFSSSFVSSAKIDIFSWKVFKSRSLYYYCIKYFTPFHCYWEILRLKAHISFSLEGLP